MLIDPYMPGGAANTKSPRPRLDRTIRIGVDPKLATDIVREIYPALALGDHFAFRADEYSGVHPVLLGRRVSMKTLT